MVQPIVHYGVHFVLPLLMALLVYRSKWKIAFLVMLSALIIDVDHVIANPIFDSSRCSINFHPLHSYIAISIYLLMLLPKMTRIFGIGLLIHILADALDCLLM